MKTDRIYTEPELLDCSKHARHWFTDVDSAYLPNCIHCGAPRKLVQEFQVKRNRERAKVNQQKKRSLMGRELQNG